MEDTGTNIPMLVGLVVDVPEANTSQDLVCAGEVNGLAISSVKDDWRVSRLTWPSQKIMIWNYVV